MLRKTMLSLSLVGLVGLFQACTWESASGTDGGTEDGNSGGDYSARYPAGPYGYNYLDTAPDFGVEQCICDPDGVNTGQPVYLGDFLAEDAVLLTVHAGTCPYCKQQAETMEADLQTPYGDDGLGILLLLYEDDDGSRERQNMLDYCCYYQDRYGLSFTMAIDPGGEAAGRFFSAAPMNMLLDTNMVINYKVEGFAPDSNALEGMVEGLIYD